VPIEQFTGVAAIRFVEQPFDRDAGIDDDHPASRT
jgi:hypothetical protein